MDVHYSSNTVEWYTPEELFLELENEFCFTLDPCGSLNSPIHKYFDKIYTIKEDGLSKNWDHEVVYMNPPYGREIGKWVKKASESKGIVVALLPARTCTKWFHSYILDHAEIRFIKGRIKFVGANNSAPFPSMIVIWRNKKNGKTDK